MDRQASPRSPERPTRAGGCSGSPVASSRDAQDGGRSGWRPVPRASDSPERSQSKDRAWHVRRYGSARARARRHRAVRRTVPDAPPVELRDGELYLRDGPDEPWARLALDRFLRAIHFRSGGGTMLTAEAFYDPPSELPDWEKSRGNMSACYAYGTQAVEVEVDLDTGEIRILRMAAVHDVGKVLHPQALAGQIYGALAQGVGYALYEEVRTENGRILNPGFTDYELPGIHEMSFPIELAFVEPGEPTGPFGAKGVGEPGLVPTAPAIRNAVCDAVGVRLHHLPMTPERVLAALRERDGEADTAGDPTEAAG